MFSFIKKYAESLSGVDVYGDIGLILFVVVFAAVVVVALYADKSYVEAMAQIPLNDSTKN